MSLIKLARQGESFRFWYVESIRAIKKYCRENNIDYGEFCDILAITSPRKQVAANIRVTKKYFAGQKMTGLMYSHRAALKHYEQTGEIRGQKCAAFARALRGDKNAVVLDVYMAIAIGCSQKQFATKQYQKHAAHIAKVAARLGWPPRETQAAIWGACVLNKWKRADGVKRVRLVSFADFI